MQGRAQQRVTAKGHSKEPDKSICDAQGLAEAGYEIVSTGGSAKAIEAAGVPVKSVDQLTGFPEMLDGKVEAPILQPAMVCMPQSTSPRIQF